MSAIAELRELARGIHSPTLSERGLPTAIGELARRSAIPVQVSVDLPDRFAEQVKTTIYYFVAEALTNSAKHGAGEALVTAELVQGAPNSLRFTVSEDGPGGADIYPRLRPAWPPRPTGRGRRSSAGAVGPRRRCDSSRHPADRYRDVRCRAVRCRAVRCRVDDERAAAATSRESLTHLLEQVRRSPKW